MVRDKKRTRLCQSRNPLLKSSFCPATPSWHALLESRCPLDLARATATVRSRLLWPVPAMHGCRWPQTNNQPQHGAGMLVTPLQMAPSAGAEGRRWSSPWPAPRPRHGTAHAQAIARQRKSLRTAVQSKHLSPTSLVSPSVCSFFLFVGASVDGFATVSLP